ncbi:MAG TPA: hypothetical protein VII27_04640 [Thermoplasmata archaeon]
MRSAASGDAIFSGRIQRRVQKVLENPRHHGYHAGGRIRCTWVAGVGNWAVLYDIDETNRAVVLLRFVSLDDV